MDKLGFKGGERRNKINNRATVGNLNIIGNYIARKDYGSYDYDDL